MSRDTVLCRLADLGVPDAKGLTLGRPGARRKLVVVRDTSGVYAYDNRCPHSNGPLGWSPDRFLSADRGHVQCGQHGSLFQIHDGLCVYGPCVGERLTPVPIMLRDGDIVLAE